MSRLKAKDFSPKVEIPCAHDGCLHPAITVLKMPTGWTNLCKQHYEFHISLEAREFAEEKGLHTIEEKRDYCRTHMPKFGAREPGQEG